MSKNIIAVPPYYKGTSFEDIVNHLDVAKEKVNRDIRFYGFAGRPFENTISSEDVLDDSRFIDGQWMLIRNIIKQKDRFEKILFLDFFSPGIDLFKYTLEQDKRNIKVGSLIHGGSFVANDLYDHSWLKYFERGWFDVNDVLYVPSYYLKNYCPKDFREKIKVKTWGLDSFIPKKSTKKKWDVIFPHRLQKDKGIERFIRIITMCSNVEFLVTTPQKKEFLLNNKYYKKLQKIENVNFFYEVDNETFIDYLSQAKIVLSCASQEAFGYSVMKAVACGCIPVLPNQACYSEFFNKNELYNKTEEASIFIKKILEEKKDNFHLKEEIMEFSFTPLLENFFK